jgi:hypothetical protein
MRKISAIVTALTTGAMALFAASASAVPAIAAPEIAAPATTAPATTAPATTVPADTVPASAPPSALAGGLDLGPMTAMTAASSTTGHDTTMTTRSSTTVGAVDPADHTASAVAKGSGAEIDEIVANGKIFVRADLGTELDQEGGISPTVWMRVDPGQIGKTNELLIQPDGSDPVDMAGIMTGITALERVDGHHLHGTIDLTKVSGHTQPDADEVSRDGAAVARVPFTVTADAHGRISMFHVDADSFDPSLSLTVAYTDYGSPSRITPPATSVPAPATVYGLFNN